MANIDFIIDSFKKADKNTAHSIVNDLHGLGVGSIFCSPSKAAKTFSRKIAEELGVCKCKTVKALRLPDLNKKTMDDTIHETFTFLFRMLWKYEHNKNPVLLVTHKARIRAAHYWFKGLNDAEIYLDKHSIFEYDTNSMSHETRLENIFLTKMPLLYRILSVPDTVARFICGISRGETTL
jgi:broad specificity phosphatase PhoE